MNPTHWRSVKEALFEALELSGDERVSYISGLDLGIREEVERLVKADAAADDFIASPFLLENSDLENVSEQIPSDIDGYRVIREIGSGGMGTVYLAEHSGEGFSQKVALKLIKRGMDTNSVLKRFLLERNILANLDHPNIARMLDGGSTIDGLPYFVLEFIDGSEIRKYCNENRYGLNERLDLFRKVCNAVSNAHQKLVVHRDLKPTNILVTKDGEPKLLDFGIAKLLSPDWNADTNEATLTLFRAMTPEYASPEQLAGEATTTATDVYSLGVILYELLAGQRPFDMRGKVPKELVENVLSKDPPRPSTVGSGHTSGHSERTASAGDAATEEGEIADPRMANTVDRKQLQGDLDNIILKALRREPERRYQSVQEFAEDIRRFQDGLPVSATADSRIYRFNKYFKRHRLGVIGTAAAAVLLIAATIVTSWQYTVAQREKNAAEKRFAETRFLAKSMLYELHNKLEQVPGTTEAREYLVESALKYIDGLAAEKIDDPDLQSELSDAYQRIADIQGGLWRANLGQREQAEVNYAKATEIMESLVLNYPERHRYKWKLGQLYASAADAAYQKTDMTAYAQLSQRSMEQLIPVETSFENDDYYEFYICDLIAGYNRSARAKGIVGELDAAYTDATRGSEIANTARTKLPSSYPVRSAVDVINETRAEVLMMMERYQEALEIYQGSLRNQDAAGDIQGSHQQTAQRNRMLTLSSIAKLQGLLGRYDDSVVSIDAALELASGAVAADPADADARLIFANFRTLKGMILERAGRYQEAVAILIVTIEDWKKIRTADPENQVYRYMESDAHGAIGKSYLALGLSGKRRSELLTAREMLEKAYATNKEFQDAGLAGNIEKAETELLQSKLKECLKALGIN